MERFRTDNTEGYTETQLAELNRRFVVAAGDEDDKSILDNIAERVLADFDAD